MLLTYLLSQKSAKVARGRILSSIFMKSLTTIDWETTQPWYFENPITTTQTRRTTTTIIITTRRRRRTLVALVDRVSGSKKRKTVHHFLILDIYGRSPAMLRVGHYKTLLSFISFFPATCSTVTGFIKSGYKFGRSSPQRKKNRRPKNIKMWTQIQITSHSEPPVTRACESTESTRK